MQTTLRLTTTILPGKRIEITSPELPETGDVELIVMLPEGANGTSAPDVPKQGVWEFIQSLPPGPRLFSTWEEYDKFLREERDAWDR